MLKEPLVIASHNEGKVKEIRELLKPLGITVISAATLNLPEPEETGDSFVANAKLKSESAALLSGHLSLADDSGLAVDGLNGAPGIYSARWAGKDKDFNAAGERIREELSAKGIESNGAAAHFVCVLALTDAHGQTQTFEGRVNGTLRFPSAGSNGFGYDPIFVPNGHKTTFGEMEASAKHAISHRALAFEKLKAHFAMSQQKEDA